MSAERVVRYAESGGLQIAYEVIGEGPLDIVLIADSGTGIDMLRESPKMARSIARLTEIGRLILVDPRGVGLSDPMERFPPVEDYVDDIRAVLDAVGSERAALFGHGYGAQLCLLFAASHPNRTVGVISLNGYARLRRAHDYPAGFPPAAEQTMLRMFSETWGTGRRLAWSSPDTMTGPHDLDWWARCERASATPRRATIRQRLVFDLDIRDVLGTIDVPVLIMGCSDDPYIRPGHAQYLAANIHGARLVELPGAHAPMLTPVRDELLDHVGDFLSGAAYRPATDRALMTVVFTDIVDSTAQASTLGDRRWRGLLEVHDAVSEREVEAARGRVVKFTGDGMMATFDGPARAVECVRSISGKLESAGLSIRAGVHTGEVEVRGEDIGGIAVHIAARVSGMASAGETLTSSTVRDLVAGSGLVFRDRGMQTLKGVPDEWRIFAVDDASR